MASLIVVVITGGGSGIGAGIARRIAREKNVFVVVADLDVNVFVFPVILKFVFVHTAGKPGSTSCKGNWRSSCSMQCRNRGGHEASGSRSHFFERENRYFLQQRRNSPERDGRRRRRQT